MTLRRPGDIFKDSIAFIISGNDDLLVRAGRSLVSTESTGVLGNGNGQSVTVNGTVIGAGDGGSGVVLFGNRVEISVGDIGIVKGDSDGISLEGNGGRIVNDGTISGRVGISSRNVDDPGVGALTVINRGSMFSELDTMNVRLQLTLVNFGLIQTASDANVAVRASDSNDVVRNSGVIAGSVSLATGNDVYDGRGGTVIGTVFGSAGNDRFVPGMSPERLTGGNGGSLLDEIDTLDFRTTTGIKVALDGGFANTGAARGDTYLQMENILGSLKGADILQGDGRGNVIQGYGGRDRLFGGDGNDTLNGGKGVDQITLGAGFDEIVFSKPSEGGDILTDFQFLDSILISRAGFKLGLSSGTLDESRFHSGTTKQASDANDRFIFETDADRLWFDRDGSKGKFAPVLIAETGGGDVLFSDIILF